MGDLSIATRHIRCDVHRARRARFFWMDDAAGIVRWGCYACAFDARLNDGAILTSASDR